MTRDELAELLFEAAENYTDRDKGPLPWRKYSTVNDVVRGLFLLYADTAIAALREAPDDHNRT